MHNQNKNVLVTLVEIPKPMITLGSAQMVLDISPRHTGQNRRWRGDAPSYKQLEYLKSFSVLPTTRDVAVFNKGQVSDVLDALVYNQRQREKLEYHLAVASGIKLIGA